MSTTSLKLPEDLKERAASAAQELGLSTHAFMVEAIRHATENAEQRAQFIDEAIRAREEMMETGLGFEHDEVHTYLKQRLADANAPRPAPKPWRK